jgi:hypothetical protein
MNVIVSIQAKLVWKWGRSKRGLYLATCPAIKQTVQADRWEDLLGSINESLDSTLREVFESGDFENFLREHGWKAQNVPPNSPKGKRGGVSFDVPFDLRGVRSRDLEEALCQ